MADGFLGRWSRRKLDVKEGREVEPAPPGPASVPAAAATRDAPHPPLRTQDEEAQVPPPPPPTLEDAQALTPASDFSRFTGSGVAPEVSNAAMKKLFTDPHYNIMDGLDTYIDDYSKPDPIPPAMLRQLASAKFLKLFDDEEAAEKPAALSGRDDADRPPGPDVAQSGHPNELPSQPDITVSAPSHTDHADPDLRLQQDDAPPGKGPGSGAQ